MQWTEFRSHIGHLPARDLKRIQKAFEMGKEAHGGQMRKSGDLYFTHPIAVALMLADMGADADTLISALLHDTIEDTDLTLREIDNAFNGDVAALIDGVTKLEPKDFAHKPALDDQIETLRKMFTEMQKDIRVMVIKLVDRLHNMQTAGHLPDARKRLLAQETLDVYVKIADRLSMQNVRDELEQLCLAILDPALLEKLIALRERNEAIAGKAIQKILKETERSSRSLKGVELIHENKSWRRLEAQLSSASSVVTGLSAVTVAFVCETVDHCYVLLGALHQTFQREAMSFQDFINVPMINGYKGLHTTILLKDGTRVRCKIRTMKMHAYARSGIATICFDSKAVGLSDHLPWTKHLSALSKDTVEQSDQFWESLQSDILGESIVIHGSNDKQVHVPKGSTALDGAFFLFGDEAMYVSEVRVNGRIVDLYEPLTHACSISATFTKETQLKLKWLDYVKTGFASSVIHAELARAPLAEKEALGKSLLARSLQKYAHVSVQELNEKSMQDTLQTTIGLPSLSTLYIHLAEGKIDPDAAVAALFPHQRKNGRELLAKQSKWQLRAFATETVADQVAVIVQPFRPIRFSSGKKRNRMHITAIFNANSSSIAQIQLQLKTILDSEQWTLHRIPSIRALRAAVILLVLLWGLDPVFARMLLTDLSAYDLTLIRFLTFFSAGTVAYLLQRTVTKRKFKPISPFNPSLILSGVALFGTALLSYLALTELSAAQYILFIIGGLVLANFVVAIVKHSVFQWFALISLMLILLSFLILTRFETVSSIGVALAAGSSLGFILYSSASNRHQQETEIIQARYPALLFWISAITALLSLLLYPYNTIGSLTYDAIIEAVAFVSLFSIFPYILYLECMRRLAHRTLNLALPTVALWALVGEASLTHSIAPILALPSVALAVALLFFQQHPRR